MFEDESSTDIFNDVMGIVSSPDRTNNEELKKESYYMSLRKKSK